MLTRNPWKKRSGWVLAVTALLISNLIGFSIGRQWDHRPHTRTAWLENVAHAAENQKAPENKESDKKPGSTPEAALLKHSSESFRAVAKLMSPSVVVIKSSRTMKAKPPMIGPRGRGRRPMPPQDDDDGSGMDDPFFDFFRHFGQPFGGGPMPQPGPQSSLGSGFIIDKRGYIVTNNHVVEGGNKITVNLPGDEKNEVPAKVIGTDPRSDLAVIKINVGHDLPAVQWADSDQVEVGDWAVAIGSPFMLSLSVTAGIVSAKGRNSQNLMGSEYSYDMLQTDAAINPGNSGGPLCTIEGKVMGVNTAIYTQSGGYMGIGFAIPSNVAKEVVNTLISGGKVVRGWLGVAIQPVDDNLAKDLGIGDGVLVQQVTPGSPAEKSGVKPGDVLLEVDGKKVTDVAQVQHTVMQRKPGEKLHLKVINYNDKKTRNVDVKIGELPTESAEAENDTSEDAGQADKLGISVAGAGGEGVRVERVQNGSIAEQLGIKPGDVIVSINREPVKSVDGYRKLVKASKKLNMLIRRGGQELFFRLALPE